MKLKLTGNTLLIERVPTVQVGKIFMPPQAMDDWNNGNCKMYRILAKGPGRLTKKGVMVPFEAEPQDNIIVWPIRTQPQDIGEGKFVLKNPEEAVLAVIPVEQIRHETASA